MYPQRPPPYVSPDLDAALSTLSADTLRDVVREVLRELDEPKYSTVVSALITRAARGDSGWKPAEVTDEHVAEVLAFVKTAELVGEASPAQVDAYLRRGSAAFLRRDYAVAQRLFGALLPAIGDGDIYLGQREVVDEVLGADLGECAAQYVVASYMTAPIAERANVVRDAIVRVDGTLRFWQPLREMERVAVEPLPALDEFLPSWHALLTRQAESRPSTNRDIDQDSWLREAVQRLEGAEGLAKVARTTRRGEDLRAWCESLVDASHFEAALDAFTEAASLVIEHDYARGEFLDKAALIAAHLGRQDLAVHLEQAWRAEPTMPRLCRWLGSQDSQSSFAQAVTAAFAACPIQATSQRGLLLVLSNDPVAAANLLAGAPNLGWFSEDDSHSLFAILARLLSSVASMTAIDPTASASTPALERGFLNAQSEADLDALAMGPAGIERALPTPELDLLLTQAGVGPITDAGTRASILTAMKTAAERRIAAATADKHRRDYQHAARLVATCVACDDSGETRHWAAALQGNYRRYPALRRAFEQALTSS